MSKLYKKDSQDSNQSILLHENRIIAYRGYVDENNIRQGLGKEYHDNGVLKYYGNFNKGGIHSEDCQVYSSEGIIVYRGGYKIGLKDGKGKLFHRNGKRKYEGMFKNDKMCGDEIVIYNSEGRIVQIAASDVETGMFEGYGEEFHWGGGLRYSGSYKSNQPHSELFYLKTFEDYDKLFGPESALRQNCIFFDKFGPRDKEDTIHFINNLLRNIQEFVGPLENIIDVSEIYNADGTLLYRGLIWSGNKFGYGITFHYNGKLEYKGLFMDNEKIGNDCSTYNESGIKVYRGGLYAGKFEGNGTIYHTNGQVHYSGYFKGNHLFGPSRMYHDNGAIRVFGNFVQGKAEGMGSEYLKTGHMGARGYFWENAIDYSRFFVIYYANGQISEIGEKKLKFAGEKGISTRGVKVPYHSKRYNKRNSMF